MESLNEYVINFLSQQKCHRHPLERAKMLKLNKESKESFICSQCIELDSQSQLLTLKRACELVQNFILFDQQKFKHFDVKPKLIQFHEQFLSTLKTIEQKVNDFNTNIESNQRQYQAKIGELQRLHRHLNNITESKTANVNDQVKLSESLKNSILLLVQNDQLLSVCNQRKRMEFVDKIDEKTRSLQQILEDCSRELDSAKEVTLDNSIVSRSPTASPKSVLMMQSTFSSQLSGSLLGPFQFRNVHEDFKLLSPIKLRVPMNDKRSGAIRLAFIGPRLQEGPLKPPKSITFHIEQQIHLNLQVGVCEVGQDTILHKQIHKFFSASQYPGFNRGDLITLTVTPATGFIQLVKNKMYNQPLQSELNLQSWTNMMFVVASPENGGGGDISILYDHH